MVGDDARERGLTFRSFTFLRHPVARVVSLYDYYIRCNKNHPRYNQTRKMSLVEFVGSNAEAPNEMTRMLCGSACSATTTAAAAVAVAKQHLLDEFVFVGLQECFPESEAILASKLPWTSHDGLAELRDNVAPKTRTTITHHERKEILTHNSQRMGF